MNHRERMLATLRGEGTDMIPWAPRLDLWYSANRRAGTLPAKYRHATLREMIDDLGFAYHAVVPQFRDLRTPLDDVHRALGIYNLWSLPYATKLENVKFTVTTEGDRTRVAYRTPVGAVTTTTVYNEDMRRAGISITHVAEHAIKSRDDYAAVGYIFENARVVPNEEGYREYAENVGESGIAVGFINPAASPMHLLQRELMPMELFFRELYYNPDELARCAASIGTYYERLFDIIPGVAADVCLWGANYDAGVTYPLFFAAYIQSWLQRAARRMHEGGKYLLTHADGENTGLLDFYLEGGVDVADSICPAPMTKLSFKEVRDRFAGRITIMGGIPSVCLLKDSLSDRDFDAYLDRFFSDIGAGDHLILGISDTTPPAAEFDRLVRIGRRVAAFGPVGRRPHSGPSRRTS
ncbi:MAG: hypothetical protein M1457_08160 [bacterium]|nr:hypothetical protein [bacterium]